MVNLIQTEQELENVLTTPRQELVEFIRNVSSPLILLGAGGKMGPTLALLALRAAQSAGHPLDVIAVSRFSNDASRRWLEESGIKTISADLLDREAAAKLPEAQNVIYLAGLKFGTAQNPSMTWAINTLAPAHVAERYRAARIVALSTGNVYPYVAVASGGALESHALTPIGEYPNAAVARERIFEHFSRQNKTPMALLRLSYAVELRYGVLVDIAHKVWAGEPIDLANGAFNCIWQGDANEMILRALSLTSVPAQAWNLTGPQPLKVRETAEWFAREFQRPARFTGTESNTALLANASLLCSRLGTPPTTPDMMMRWIAQWVQMDGRSLNKPTHFEVRDGSY